MDKLKSITITWDNLICSLVIGWLVAYVLLGSPMGSSTIDATMSQNFLVTMILLMVTAVVAFLFGVKWKRLQHIFVLLIVFGTSVLTLFIRTDEFTSFGFAIIIGLLTYIFREDIVFYTQKVKITEKQVKVIFILLGGALFALIAFIGLARYWGFFAPGHDLGLFTQMYEYMLDSGKQFTTVERNALMSHFEIHVSPIYYLLLPIYFVFSSPITLQICQAVLIAASMIPFYLLCKHYQLNQKTTVLLSVCYVCYPALTGGIFNDFHENCFLPLLLFTLIYMVEKNKTVGFYICLILSLLVKEDVALQLIVLALFFMISKKNVKKGGVLFGASAVYFVIAIWILNQGNQGGVLSYMDNMTMTENGGVMEAIQIMLMNPGYTLRQCFSTVENIQYAGWILLPVGAAIFTKKEYSRYILLIYMVLLNLMPSYDVLTDIYFQYNFPVIVFVFYIMIMNISEWKEEKQKRWMPVMVFMVGFLFLISVLQTGLYTGIEAIQGRGNASTLEEAIDMIEEDSSVSASSLLIPHLTEHKELYGLYYEYTDYIIVDYRAVAETPVDQVAEWVDEDLYEVIYEEWEVVCLYKKK